VWDAVVEQKGENDGSYADVGAAGQCRGGGGVSLWRDGAAGDCAYRLGGVVSPASGCCCHCAGDGGHRPCARACSSVWEEHSEKVDEMLEHNIPVFVENVERKIEVNENEAYNFLLEGDNLHSLKLLEKTHKGKIDVIYIDPPYNTGNKDFIYNDSFVDKTDGYSHSKWLSFMEKRLLIAKELLSDEGVIFISIDDNEQAQLKLLCDNLFGEENFVAYFIWQKRTSPDARRRVSNAHEYIACYCKIKEKENEIFNLLSLSDDDKKMYKNPDNDPRGPWRSTDFGAQGWRPNQMYKISTPGGVEYTPSEGRCWKNIEEKYYELLKDGRMWFGKDGRGVPRKKVYLSEKKGKNTWTWWNNIEVGNTQEGTQEVKKIFGTKIIFDYPKPTRLIKRIVQISSKNDSIIIDFFAGSGTTGHAVMQLNKEDGGNRKYILCTNNENNICEEVTYQRLKNIQEELPHNLKYYKTDFIPKFTDDEVSISDKMMKHIIELIELEYAIELDGKKYIILDDEDGLDESISKIENGGKLFVRSGIFLSRSNQRILEEKGINIIEIPEYYFRKELKEVGEQ